MKILIIGGLGYLGYRIGSHLKAANFDIIYTTRNNRYTDNNSVVLKNFSKLELEKILNGVNTIIYAAGMSSEECKAFPKESLRSANYSFKNVFDTAIKLNISNFFYISSSQVYKESQKVIQEESATMIKDDYTKRHLIAEEYIKEKNKLRKMKSYILRLSNSFGSPIKTNKNCWNLVINNFCKSSITNNQLIIQSDGLQVKNFVNINYLCDAIKHLIDMNSDNLDIIYNIGGMKSFSIIELANIIVKRSNALFLNNPTITILNKSKSSSFPVIYSSNKLIKTGFRKNNKKEFNKEIDDLLIYCKKELAS